MNIWPLKFRQLTNDQFIFSDDTGQFFTADERFLERYATDTITKFDTAFLGEGGHTFERENDIGFTSFAYRWSARQKQSTALNYIILVPTLRCNLSCAYCQVSRAAETAPGFDWTSETLDGVLKFIDNLASKSIKIEFQGGEPLLRTDLLDKVRAFCRNKFDQSEFVVCTNLQSLGDEEWRFLDANDTHISTSIDGDPATHERQRTVDTKKTEAFFKNLDLAVKKFGSDRISALPTIDVVNPPEFESLVETYERVGLDSIYLRPINHQGFARKRMPKGGEIGRWNALHSDFIDFLIERNHKTGRIISEYYFSQALNRVMRPGLDDHVDLRNPNFLGDDYLVIDYDGQIFPTDEARMLYRTRRVDLNIGHVASGLDQNKIDELNTFSLNTFDTDCVHCAFQPFCATDIVDDLSREGRIDLPRTDTWFCKRHLSLFDKIFDLLYSDDPATQFSVAAWLGVSTWSPSQLRKLS